MKVEPFPVAVALLLLTGFVTACDSTKESPEARVKQLEEYARSHGIDAEVAVDVDSQGKESVVVKQDVAGMQFQSGKDLTVPEDFPKDVPVFPALKIISAAKLPIGHLLQGKTDTASDEVAKFYRDELPKQGWTNVTPSGAQSPVIQSMRFTKDQRAVAISLIQHGADTTVQISLTPAG
jgi:hypothetical protein